ncbi:MAG: zf-TFIIB domain-containing protein [Candidatus Omnitrophota bacterium]
MDCPKCVGKLEEVKIGRKRQFIINRCFACGGLWFDKGELFDAINKEIWDTVEFELEEEPLQDDELKKEVDFDKMEAACPRCQGTEKMIKMVSPRNKNVTIDYCTKCEGVWLDAGEYDKLKMRSNIELKLEHLVDFFRLHFPHIFKDKT